MALGDSVDTSGRLESPSTGDGIGTSGTSDEVDCGVGECNTIIRNPSVSGFDWNSLHPDMQDYVLAFLSVAELFQVQTVCKSFRNVIQQGNFQQARARLCPSEGSLSPLVFYVKDELWHVTGFDSKRSKWRKLPPFQVPIPASDPDLFKDFLVAGHSGLFCVNVGRVSEPEKLYVCNPLTRETFQLPPLNFQRHPVILHIHLNLAKRGEVVSTSYLVIAIGSAAIGTESLSRKTEVYDSVRGEWKTAGDVPGTDFGLNDYQTGVYCETKNLLLCVGFMADGSKGLLAFDVAKGVWRENWESSTFFQLRPVGHPALTVFFAIAQLVECNGGMYLFSEQERAGSVTHCIDGLVWEIGGGERLTWSRKLTLPVAQRRLQFGDMNENTLFTLGVSSEGIPIWVRNSKRPASLLVYPEFTCMPMGDELCIFNTIKRSGKVYDISDDSVNPDVVKPLSGPPGIENEAIFHSLNPIGYSFDANLWASAR